MQKRIVCPLLPLLFPFAHLEEICQLLEALFQTFLFRYALVLNRIYWIPRYFLSHFIEGISIFELLLFRIVTSWISMKLLVGLTGKMLLIMDWGLWWTTTRTGGGLHLGMMILMIEDKSWQKMFSKTKMQRLSLKQKLMPEYIFKILASKRIYINLYIYYNFRAFDIWWRWELCVEQCQGIRCYWWLHYTISSYNNSISGL